MGRIIAIANQKGGVAKTTSAINLAASLAVAEKTVLLIDLDPQGNTTTGLGIDQSKLQGSVYDLFIGRLALSELRAETGVKYLDLLPAHIDLVGAEVELVEMNGRETIFKDRLKGVKDLYDFVIIDCPPSLGLLTLNALTATDSLLVPLQCEYFAMEGLKMLINTMKRVQKTLNPSLHIEGILLTMFDGRNNLSNQVSSEIRSHFGSLVFTTTIPRNITLAEAPSHGLPVLYYSAVSRGAKAYLSLAEEILSRSD